MLAPAQTESSSEKEEIASPSHNSDPLPGVSIVITTFNYAHFLSDAIESALGQTYRNLEVIVVDDGSTDKTQENIRRFGDRVRYIYQENAGLSAARNTGIRAARNPLIVFLDADDRLLPNMVEAMVGMRAKLPPGFGLIGCRSVEMDVNGKVSEPKVQPGGKEISAADLILMNRFPCTVLAERETIERCGYFDTRLRASEDRDMWIRIAAVRRVYLFSEQLVAIRRHGANMSKNAIQQTANMRKVLKKAYLSGVVPRAKVGFWLRVISFYFYQSALMLHACGKPLATLRSLGCSVVLWPWFRSPAALDRINLFRLRYIASILRRLR